MIIDLTHLYVVVVGDILLTNEAYDFKTAEEEWVIARNNGHASAAVISLMHLIRNGIIK